MKPVKTAIIGLGYFGPNLLRNFAQQTGAEMAYACDMREEALEKVRRTYPTIKTTANVSDIWNDASVELVVLATPTSSHFPLAKAALEAGKHVLVEKPMASTVEEGESLVNLAKEKGLLLFVDHTFCFAPSVEKMAALSKSGALGDLLYYDSVRINLGLIQKDADVLQDLAIHDLSIISQLWNLDDVATVCAHGSKHFGAHAEQAHIHITFKTGVTAHIHVSWLSPVKVRRTMLAGTKSMLVYDDTEPSEKIRLYDCGIEHDATKADPFFPKYRSGDILIPALPAQEPLGVEAAHILRCIREKETPRVSGEEALKVLRLLTLCRESLEKDSTVLTLS